MHAHMYYSPRSQNAHTLSAVHNVTMAGKTRIVQNRKEIGR